VARVRVPVAYSCHCTKVWGELVTVGTLYRWPHQPILFKKIIKKVFFWKKSALFWFLIGETDIKLTLKYFNFSYQNVKTYQKNLILIGVWYVGNFVWSGNMEVFDRSLTNIPIELHTNYISNFQIKDIPLPDQFVWSGRANAAYGYLRVSIYSSYFFYSNNEYFRPFIRIFE
jgi:hypothetical protein